jgi:hypothetical protein
MREKSEYATRKHTSGGIFWDTQHSVFQASHTNSQFLLSRHDRTKDYTIFITIHKKSSILHKTNVRNM